MEKNVVCVVIVLLSGLKSGSPWRVPLLGPWLGDGFWGKVASNGSSMFRPPLPTLIRKANPGEFPWAALVVFSAGPEVTAALVNDRWVISAMPPGVLSYSKSFGTDVLGRIYLGLVSAKTFAGEGKWKEGMGCPGWDGNIYCSPISEIVPEDTLIDSANCLLMVRLANPVDIPHKNINAGVMGATLLPYNHREQCMAVWFTPTKESVLRRRRGAVRRKRDEGDELKYWDLWCMPMGLWHVGHCRKDSRKVNLVCEDTMKDEKHLRKKVKGNFANKIGKYGGGSKACSPQFRRSAVAQCQGKIFAFRLQAIGGFELFELTSHSRKKGTLCSPISDAARRLWVMMAPSVDWVYYQVIGRGYNSPGLIHREMVPPIRTLKLPRPLIEVAASSPSLRCWAPLTMGPLAMYFLLLKE